MEALEPTPFFVITLADGSKIICDPPSRKYPRAPMLSTKVPDQKPINPGPPTQFTEINTSQEDNLCARQLLMMARTYAISATKELTMGLCYFSHQVRFSISDTTSTSFVNFEQKTFKTFLESDHIHLWKRWAHDFETKNVWLLETTPESIYLDSDKKTSLLVFDGKFGWRGKQKILFSFGFYNRVTLDFDELRFVYRMRGFLEHQRAILDGNRENILKYYFWYIQKCREKKISYLLTKDFSEPYDPINTIDYVQLFNEIGNLTAIINKEKL